MQSSCVVFMAIYNMTILFLMGRDMNAVVESHISLGSSQSDLSLRYPHSLVTHGTYSEY